MHEIVIWIHKRLQYQHKMLKYMPQVPQSIITNETCRNELITLCVIANLLEGKPYNTVL